MKYTNIFITSYIALTFNIFCNHIKHSLIITLFSFSDNKSCENATLISKWLQQDTFIKMSLGYGWILSVYKKKQKQINQTKKGLQLRKQKFSFNIQISDGPDSDTSQAISISKELVTQQLFRSLNIIGKLV